MSRDLRPKEALAQGGPFDSHPNLERARGRRLYALLLLLYPSSFRAEYGAEMRAIFARRRRDAASPGAVLALWAETIADVIANAARLHQEMFRQDVAYTLRTLRRTPGFTFTTVLVSALGIGATTAAFSIADHVLIRPLPFPDADRLVKLWQNQQFRGYARMEASPPNFLDWKRMSRSFERLSAYYTFSANLSGVGEPLRLIGTYATSDLFLTLRSQAALGRVFVPSDGGDEAERTVVISDSLWRQQFGANAGVLGRRVLLNDAPHLVIGVMPADFYFPTRRGSPARCSRGSCPRACRLRKRPASTPACWRSLRSCRSPPAWPSV